MTPTKYSKSCVCNRNYSSNSECQRAFFNDKFEYDIFQVSCKYFVMPHGIPNYGAEHKIISQPFAVNLLVLLMIYTSVDVTFIKPTAFLSLEYKLSSWLYRFQFLGGIFRRKRFSMLLLFYTETHFILKSIESLHDKITAKFSRDYHLDLTDFFH